MSPRGKTSAFMFHVRNAPPSDILGLLLALRQRPGADRHGILDAAAELGVPIEDAAKLDCLATAHDLQLVSGDNTLTSLGEAALLIQQRSPEAFVESLHAAQYTLWNAERPAENCWSWTYRTVCDLLWGTGSTDLSVRRLASEVQGRIVEEVPGAAGVALSDKSVRGVLRWLEALRPAVVHDTGSTRRFARRHFCTPELALCAIDALCQLGRARYGVGLYLDPQTLEALSRLCLMEPEDFERVLDYAVRQFDVLSASMSPGWGHFVSLARPVNLEALV